MRQTLHTLLDAKCALGSLQDRFVCNVAILHALNVYFNLLVRIIP
jgi:hypothetical protein